MIINSLGDQATNLIGAGFQEEAKSDEGNAQIQNAISGAYQASMTSTTQAMQALLETSGSLRSSAAQVAGDIATMVRSIGG